MTALSRIARLIVTVSLVGAAAAPVMAQRPSLDSSKIYTFVARMPAYSGGRGYLMMLSDLRQEFQAASGAVGCAVPTYPVNVNLLVGPSGVIYKAEFVNNLPPPKATAGNPNNVANTPPGPALPVACETALAAAIRKLPRLQPVMQSGRCETVRITLPLVPKSTK
jgi:hypothetical protein